MSEVYPYGVAAVFWMPLCKYSEPREHATGSDWTPAAGDVKVAQDDGAAANITTLPTYTAGKGWKFSLSATEMEGKIITVRVADSATKAVCDDGFNIVTVDDSDAMFDTWSSDNPIPADVVAASGDLSAVEVALASAAIEAIHEAAEMEHGTVQAATATSVTLESSASSTSNYYSDRGATIQIYAGTGAGQDLPVSAYDGSSKVATLAGTWDPVPDTSSLYRVIF